MNSSEILEYDDEIIYREQYDLPLESVLRILLQNIQRNPACRNKVPMLRIGVGRDAVDIYPVTRAKTVLNKIANKKTIQAEKNFIRMAERR